MSQARCPLDKKGGNCFLSGTRWYSELSLIYNKNFGEELKVREKEKEVGE
jgi:hypothetical protein